MDENNPKCFVPDCFNEVGVLFPKNLDVKKKWLNSLHLSHLKPSPTSFICLDHFDEDGESGALPKRDKIDYDGEFDPDSMPQESSTEKIDFDEDSQDINNSKAEQSQINEISAKSKNSTLQIQMCRLCMSQSENEMQSLYDKIDDKDTIAQAVITCLYPLKVSPTDKLSHNICQKCLEILREFYEFHQFCLGMDEKQRELLTIDDYNEDTNSTDDFFLTESLEEYAEKTVNMHSGNKSEIDKKFDKVEEELLKVLGVDKSSNTVVRSNDDSEYTENIVIQMVDDDEPQSHPETLLNDLPITIKAVQPDSPKRKMGKRKRAETDNTNLTMIKAGKNSNEIVVLPSGIKVKVKEKYVSPLGAYSSKSLRYIFNMQYIQADDYLYEFRLTKGNLRYLHCIALKCHSEAVQKKSEHGPGFRNEIEVILSHNHPTPSTSDKKKQMFYNILFKRMQSDKNYNFRTIYEQICKLDRTIEDILPIRKVINEICKYGPLPEMPASNTFDDFYNTIEYDMFHKIHFTENQVQFYQNRFETEAGAKAVVFGNSDVISKYSSSKLMFVDASFNIETEDFFYQLVTVLVWVHDSYYPVLFAFVNQKSQELYKQIFGFLYNNLAPNLRPEEIITDYEANLYYALGETYLESSIGGSIFYFTQNLYKKVCGLKLSRELELNSNFRSVYNMLLMLPLLPVNTIVDGLHNIQTQAKEMGLDQITKELFAHVQTEWIAKVSPELFCVHRLENRINENIVAPFKKLRDLIMLCKSKSSRNQSVSVSITLVIEKIIELEKFLRDTYNSVSKKSFARDLSSSQKKIVLKAWNFIEDHPKININNFFMKVLGYIKCMENQLWIWGFYRFEGNTNDDLINASNFSIIGDSSNYAPELIDIMEVKSEMHEAQEYEEETEGVVAEYYVEDNGNIKRVDKRTGVVSEEYQPDSQQVIENGAARKQAALLMEAVANELGVFDVQNGAQNDSESSAFENHKQKFEPRQL